MVDRKRIGNSLGSAFDGSGLPERGRHSGKVREWYSLPDGHLFMATTDRLSAFDRILASVPWKGQVLNQLSAWWFEETKDIVPNHFVSAPDPNVSLLRPAAPLPVEVIVRGYITGVTSTALWHRYSLGEREIYGYRFSGGLRKNQRLPEAVITPTTKGGPTGHDERLTCDEVVSKGLVEEGLWKRVMEASHALYARGVERATRAGLILVDTKYEFGVDRDGNLLLIDEVHTPDSSRFWKADTYDARFETGTEPESFDKEYVRIEYAARGYRGDGEAPKLPESVWIDTSVLYQTSYEKLTGRDFVPAEYPAGPRITALLARFGVKS
ncbi:MAG: phosphoribosylaminoimidazolesuccinocarboxamide synthase [Rectinemataceae bacterium]